MSRAVDCLALADARKVAMERLQEVTHLDSNTCLATMAAPPSRPKHRQESVGHTLYSNEARILSAGGQPVDNRPCLHCESD